MTIRATDSIFIMNVALKWDTRALHDAMAIKAGVFGSKSPG